MSVLEFHLVKPHLGPDIELLTFKFGKAGTLGYLGLQSDDRPSAGLAASICWRGPNVAGCPQEWSTAV